MHNPGNIVIIPGSARRESLNLRYASHLKVLVEELGAVASVLQPATIDLPIYDGDLESSRGLPSLVLDLKKDFHAADALVFVSPEYNGSVSPLLKNMLDWVSRPAHGAHAALMPFRNKPVALFSAGPGKFGGVSGLRHLREILISMKAMVIPQEHALSGASFEMLQLPELPDLVLGPSRDVLTRLLNLAARNAA